MDITPAKVLTIFKDNLTLITIIFLFWSFGDIYYRFFWFGIDISTFASMNDFVLMVLPKLATLFFLPFCLAAMLFLTYKMLPWIDKLVKFSRILWLFLNLIVLLLNFMLVDIQLTMFNAWNGTFFSRWAIGQEEVNIEPFYAQVVIVGLTVIMYTIKYPEILEKNVKKWVWYVNYVGFVVMASCTNSLVDKYRLEHALNTRSYYVKIGEKEYTTSKEWGYIGQTPSYLFLYNAKTKQKRVIKISEADIIQFK